MPKFYKKKKVYRKKKIYRKKRLTAKITRTLRPTIINCVRCVNHVIDLNSLMNVTGYGYYTPIFSANPTVISHGIYEWANFKTLFRGFRISGIRTEFVLAANTAWGGGAITPALPQVELRMLSARTAPDGSQIPTTLEKALQIKQSKSYFLRLQSRQPFKCWSPAYYRNTIMGASSATHDTTTGNIMRSKFLGTSNGENVPHLTQTYIFQMSDFTKPDANAVNLQLRHYIYFQMKGQTF